MKKNPPRTSNAPRPHFPRTLIDLRNLEGGSYGRFTLIARDSDTLEIQLGTDFVRINAAGAAKLGEVMERFAGRPAERLDVDFETDDDGDVVVVTVKEEQPKLPRTRRASPRRTPPPPSA